LQATLKGTIKDILAAEIGSIPIGEIITKSSLELAGPRNVASSTLNSFNTP
jgi:hypothetical protein